MNLEVQAVPQDGETTTITYVNVDFHILYQTGADFNESGSVELTTTESDEWGEKYIENIIVYVDNATVEGITDFLTNFHSNYLSYCDNDGCYESFNLLSLPNDSDIYHTDGTGGDLVTALTTISHEQVLLSQWGFEANGYCYNNNYPSGTIYHDGYNYYEEECCWEEDEAAE